MCIIWAFYLLNLCIRRGFDFKYQSNQHFACDFYHSTLEYQPLNSLTA